MYIEDEYTELKIELTKDIKKEIIAFANTKGGKIYIGIDDGGNIIGLNNAKRDLESLSGMIREGIKSDLTLYTSVNLINIDGKDIIEINVMDAPNKPYYLTDKGIKTSGVYLRYGNTSAPASEEVIKKMLIENQGDSFETLVSQNQNLNFETLKYVRDNNNILRKINIHGSYKYAYEFMRKIYEDKIEELSSDVDAQYIGLNSMSISYNDNTIKYLLLTDNKIFKEDDYYEQDETATNKA